MLHTERFVNITQTRDINKQKPDRFCFLISYYIRDIRLYHCHEVHYHCIDLPTDFYSKVQCLGSRSCNHLSQQHSSSTLAPFRATRATALVETQQNLKESYRITSIQYLNGNIPYRPIHACSGHLSQVHLQWILLWKGLA